MFKQMNGVQWWLDIGGFDRFRYMLMYSTWHEILVYVSIEYVFCGDGVTNVIACSDQYVEARYKC